MTKCSFMRINETSDCKYFYFIYITLFSHTFNFPYLMLYKFTAPGLIITYLFLGLFLALFDVKLGYCITKSLHNTTF